MIVILNIYEFLRSAPSLSVSLYLPPTLARSRCQPPPRRRRCKIEKEKGIWRPSTEAPGEGDLETFDGVFPTQEGPPNHNLEDQKSEVEPSLLFYFSFVALPLSLSLRISLSISNPRSQSPPPRRRRCKIEKVEMVEFKIYNSMTQQKEVFTPKEPGKVGLYVCGVTTYDFSHIGHARAAVNFDVLYRYLKHLGYEVTYVRNFTDVDDKIIRRANERGENPLALSDRFCQEYLVDMGDLQCLPPTHQPRVSDHMEQIKDMITQIIKNEYGYLVDGDVFFSVDKCPNYGQLSGQKLENHREGGRVAVDSRKRNPADFALWKAAKPGEPSWESPWGPGRPGWHIECSAMSSHYLTFKFDIHGGGIDLIFPHHENEVAQSCAACQESKVGFWMHNGHVTNNYEKMSKSLGNFFTIRQITERYHPLALRLFLLSAHYRSPLNYTVSQLDSASDTLYYINQTLQDCEDALSQFQGRNLTDGLGKKGNTPDVTKRAKDCEKCIINLPKEFHTKMADDLNLSNILSGTFHKALVCLNGILNLLKEGQQMEDQFLLIQSLSNLKKEVIKVLDVFGLLSSSTYSEVLQQFKDKALKRAKMEEDDVMRLIKERASARKKKDFARTDHIRAGLLALGIALMDVGKETIWRPCVPVEPEPPVEQNVMPPPMAERTADGAGCSAWQERK